MWVLETPGAPRRLAPLAHEAIVPETVRALPPRRVTPGTGRPGSLSLTPREPSVPRCCL